MHTRVAILTEGNSSTGYGHLTRCHALYQAFEERQIRPTLIVNSDVHSTSYVRGDHIIILDWITNSDRLLNELLGVDLLIIDTYLAHKELLESIWNTVPTVAFIDDYERIGYPRGTIINGTIDAEFLQYSDSANVEKLLGVSFIPLRKDFWDPPQKTLNDTVKNVLITFGGADLRQLSFIVRDLIESSFDDLNMHVVLGNSTRKDSFSSCSNERTKFYEQVCAADMLDLMLNCDIAISGAGQTINELARVGISTIAIGIAQNQRNNINGWLRNGYLLDALWWNDPDLKPKLVDCFRSTSRIDHRNKVRKSIPRLIDGQGARRIVDQLVK